jgi:hypothetical protein
MAFIRKKTIKGETYHYLVKSVRVKGKPVQKVLAYLGKFDNVEDAYVSATGKRRAKLAKYRKPEDVNNDQVLRDAELHYRRERRGAEASARAIKIMLPGMKGILGATEVELGKGTGKTQIGTTLGTTSGTTKSKPKRRKK